MEKLTESIFDKDKLQLEEEEEIKNTITNVELYSDAATRLGDGGDLTMTTRCKDGEYCVYWKNVLLHALSKDTSTFPKPCLYCQIDDAMDGGDDDEYLSAGEAYFVFGDDNDGSKGDAAFKSFSECCELNPDEEFDGEPEGDGMLFTAGGEAIDIGEEIEKEDPDLFADAEQDKTSTMKRRK